MVGAYGIGMEKPSHEGADCELGSKIHGLSPMSPVPSYHLIAIHAHEGGRRTLVPPHVAGNPITSPEVGACDRYGLGYNQRMRTPKSSEESRVSHSVEPLEAWCFVGGNDLWALTDDRSGAKLPAEHGPWRMLKPILLTGSEPDEQEAAALIRQYGYCCFENGEAD